MDAWTRFVEEEGEAGAVDLPALLNVIAGYGDGDGDRELASLLSALRPEVASVVRRLSRKAENKGPLGPLEVLQNRKTRW